MTGASEVQVKIRRDPDEAGLDDCDLEGVAAAIVQLVAENAERINEITEGALRFLVWPDGDIEFDLTELIDQVRFEYADGRVAARNADVLARAKADVP